MRIGARVEGTSEHKDAMRLLLTRLDLGTRNATQQAAEDMRDRIKEHLRTYSHPPGTRVTPSPPFIGPPAYVTGHLHDSVEARDLHVAGRFRWSMMVAPDTDYDRIQELSGFSGKHHATFTPPRPYITPMIARGANAVRERFRAEWEVILRG